MPFKKAELIIGGVWQGFYVMFCTGRFAVFETANLQAGLLISLFLLCLAILLLTCFMMPRYSVRYGVRILNAKFLVINFQLLAVWLFTRILVFAYA